MKKTTIRFIFLPCLLIVLTILSTIVFMLPIFFKRIEFLSFLVLPVILFIVLISQRKFLFSYIEVSENGIGKKYKNQILCYLNWNEVHEVMSHAPNEIVFIGNNQTACALYKKRENSIIINLNIFNATKKLANYNVYFKNKITNLDKISVESKKILLQ